MPASIILVLLHGIQAGARHLRSRLTFLGEDQEDHANGRGSWKTGISNSSHDL